MTTRTHLIAKTNEKKSSHPLVGQLFIKPSGNGAEISENGGPILVFEQDGVVTVKIENDVSSVNYNKHPVKKGGIYFLELGDAITCKETTITMIEVDIIETASISTDGLVDIELEKTQVLFSADNKDFDEKTRLTEVHTTKEKDQDLGFSVDTAMIKKAELNIRPKAKPATEVTRTSIDIGELLQTQKKQTRKEKIDQLDSEDSKDPAVIAKKKKAVLNKKLEVKAKKSDTIEVTKRVGPFTRLFSILAGVSITTALYHLVDKVLLMTYSNKILDLIVENIPQLTMIKDHLDLGQEIISVLLVYFSVNLISNLIFSTSIPLFLVGATTDGSFITKRIKAILRLPLEIISFFIPVLDFPVLIGKRTFKEFATGTQIQYRQRIFKLIAVPLLIVISIVPHFEYFIKAKVEKKPEIPAIYSTMFTQEKAVKSSVLLVSKGMNLNYEIVGSSEPKLNFFMINKIDGKTIALREIRSIKYESLETLRREIPFFSQIYPSLNSRIDSSEDNLDSTGVREDVLNFIKSGEFSLCGDIKRVNQLNILTTNTAARFLKENNLLFEKIYITNNETRYYEYKGEFSLLAVTNDAIKVLAVDTNIEEPWNFLNQVALSFNGHGKVSELDSIFKDPSLYSSQKSLITEKLNAVKLALSKNFDQSNSVFFEKFVKGLIDQTPQDLAEFQAYLLSLL